MTLKRSILFSLALVLAVGLMGTPAKADLMGMTAKHVYVNVEPNVTVGAQGEALNNGMPIQTGEFYLMVPFRIDANKQKVKITILATPLFKGDDPTNNDVAPIPLCGVCDIDPENANPTGGVSSIAQIVGDDTIFNFPASKFNTVEFESSQNNHFSQDLIVKVCWDQVDPEQPMGEYSGYVKLIAMVGN